MNATNNDEQLTGLAGLGDPLRRALYSHVAERGEPVSREDAAAAVGISHPLAAYHLDKLIDDGLLAARYQRRSGRRGPGAGRPAKHYIRSDRRIELSLPARDYAGLAELLAGAVEADSSGTAQAALHRAAATLGAELGTETATHAADGNPGEVLASLRQALAGAATSPTRMAAAPSGCATAPSTASPPSTASWPVGPTSPCSRASPTTSPATRRPGHAGPTARSLLRRPDPPRLSDRKGRKQPVPAISRELGLYCQKDVRRPRLELEPWRDTPVAREVDEQLAA